MASETLLDLDQERILVIRFSTLGDVLLTAPTVRALRRRFPLARIEMLVAHDYREAAEMIPGLDDIIAFDRREGIRGLLWLRRRLSRRFTLLVDLQNTPRSAFLRWAIFPTMWTRARRYRLSRWVLIHTKLNLYRGVRPVALRYLDSVTSIGSEDDQRGLELSIPAASIEWYERFRARHQLAHTMTVLCPGARHTTKRWPMEQWTELAMQLCRDEHAVVAVGAAHESSLIEGLRSRVPAVIGLCGESIANLAALFEKAVVVTNDSGLMHLACGVGAPVIAIFGPTDERFGFYPFRAKSELLAHDMSCRPCSAHGSARCPKGHFRCMLQTTPEMVRDAIHRIRGLAQQQS